MSFGSGFAQGMYAGSAVAQRGMDNYDARQEEEMKDQIIQYATEKQELDDAGNVRGSVIDSVGNASIGDINSQLVDLYVSKNGKIDSKAYGFINDLSSGLFSIKEAEKEYQNKETLFGLKTQKYEADIANKYDQIDKRVKGGRRSGGESASSDTGAYGEDGKLDLSKVKIGSRLFKSMPQDVRRAVLFSQGIEGKPSPRAKTDIDMTAIEEETPMAKPNDAKTKPATETKKASWKDYL